MAMIFTKEQNSAPLKRFKSPESFFMSVLLIVPSPAKPAAA